jgi:hypothetical protein
LLAGVRAIEARQRAGRLEPADYVTELRALIDSAVGSRGAQDQVQVAELVPEVPA